MHCLGPLHRLFYVQRTIVWYCASMLAVSGHAAGQDGPATGMARGQAPCHTDAHRAFDFWLGEWDVFGPDGKLAGRSRVVAILDGCVVQEEWDSTPDAPNAPTVRGRSLSLLDRGAKTWHQTYVDNSGALLRLDGDKEGESMTMTGERMGGDGRVRRYRLTWSPRSGDEVHQLFEVSVDEGRSWQVAFEGRYVRRPPETP